MSLWQIFGVLIYINSPIPESARMFHELLILSASATIPLPITARQAPAALGCPYMSGVPSVTAPL